MPPTPRLSVLLIGPRSTQSPSGRNGGVTAVVDDLCLALSERHLDLSLFDMNGRTRLHAQLKALRLTSWLFGQAVIGRRFDHVVFCATYWHWIVLVPLLRRLLAKRTRLCVRKFAGNLAKRYSKASGLEAALVRLSVAAASVTCFETKEDAAFFAQFGPTDWWPNSRLMSRTLPAMQPLPVRNKVGFFGRISREKGIDVLADIAKSWPRLEIELYGPIESPALVMDYKNLGNLKFCDAVPHQQVAAKMRDVDCVLLPTKYESEGYPGVLVEAVHAGVPFLVSPIAFAREVLVDVAPEFIVNTRDSKAWINSITFLQKHRHEMNSRIRELKLLFDSAEYVDRFVA